MKINIQFQLNLLTKITNVYKSRILNSHKTQHNVRQSIYISIIYLEFYIWII